MVLMYINKLQSCIISEKKMIYCLKLYNLSISLFEIFMDTFLFKVIFIFGVYFIKIKIFELMRHKIYLL